MTTSKKELSESLAPYIGPMPKFEIPAMPKYPEPMALNPTIKVARFDTYTKVTLCIAVAIIAFMLFTA
jgi:hypothetical protein